MDACSKRRCESMEAKEERLFHRRERERDHCASETAAQKEE